MSNLTAWVPIYLGHILYYPSDTFQTDAGETKSVYAFHQPEISLSSLHIEQVETLL